MKDRPNFPSRFLLRVFPYVRYLDNRAKRLAAEAARLKKFSDPGHFYSPLPSLEEIDEAFARGVMDESFEGIDLREEAQLALLEKIIEYYAELPFPEAPSEGWRYHLDNPSYGLVDCVSLYGMIRHLRPQRIIEVGSGYSSAAMLDINDREFGGKIALTFIDPDMTSLRDRCGAIGISDARCIEKKVQEVPVELFRELQAGDILFLDSSHVSKVGSDLNHLFFKVLPKLNVGVYVHFHDITWSFEYPRDWLENGIAWNEQYLLRAFLMYNTTFEIALFPPWLLRRHTAYMYEKMPRLQCGGGGQIWLRRSG